MASAILPATHSQPRAEMINVIKLLGLDGWKRPHLEQAFILAFVRVVQ
jgi:hypothetical protein